MRRKEALPVGSPVEICGSGDRRRIGYMSEDEVIPPFSAPAPLAPGHFGASGGRTISEPPTTNEKFDDDDYPAYTMGRAADMLGTTQAFLRTLDEANLITPQRSAGGHRRYSRYQLRIAARARELMDSGTPLEAACRIIILEDQLAEAREINAKLTEQD